jgi:hypothetical protein
MYHHNDFYVFNSSNCCPGYTHSALDDKDTEHTGTAEAKDRQIDALTTQLEELRLEEERLREAERQYINTIAEKDSLINDLNKELEELKARLAAMER